MIKKLIKVGNSYAITIPKSFVEGLGLSAGDVVDVRLNEDEQKITIHFNLDEEVYKVGKKILKKYNPAFKNLSK